MNSDLSTCATLAPCWSRYIVTTIANIGDFGSLTRNKAVTNRYVSRNKFQDDRTRQIEQEVAEATEAEFLRRIMIMCKMGGAAPLLRFTPVYPGLVWFTRSWFG